MLWLKDATLSTWWHMKYMYYACTVSLHGRRSFESIQEVLNLSIFHPLTLFPFEDRFNHSTFWERYLFRPNSPARTSTSTQYEYRVRTTSSLVAANQHCGTAKILESVSLLLRVPHSSPTFVPYDLPLKVPEEGGSRLLVKPAPPLEKESSNSEYNIASSPAYNRDIGGARSTLCSSVVGQTSIHKCVNK